MKTTYLIAAAIGIAAGYFGAKTLRNYAPFNTVYAKGAGMA